MEYIPVLDFSPLSEKNGRIPREEDWETTQQKIYKALHEVGFVYIINHDVNQKIIDWCFEESRSFFAKPLEEKLKYKSDGNSTGNYHGYTQPNQEKLNSSSSFELRESFDFSTKVRPDHPNPIFHQESDLQNKFTALRANCTPLIFKILRLFARALHEDENYFVNQAKGIWNPDIPTFSTLRTLYYPKVSEYIQPRPGMVRCAEHTDYGILTLLFQDDIGGLEVKTVHNTWVPANPIPGAILINTGDLLEFWSGGHFLATAHRVLIPETELKKRIPRQSIAFFIHADDSAVVSPLKFCERSNFEPITAYEHAKRKLQAAYGL